MRLKKIHRVLQFTQEPWMKPYIDFNTNKRSKAKNDFEKDLFKLMNNSVFGKTMENIRKRVSLKFVRTEEEALKLVRKTAYEDSDYISMLDFYVCRMKKTKLLFNKPLYTGFCVSDISKLLMYDFYYDHMKKKYGDKCSLLYTDTDSLILHIKTEDVYKDTLEDIDLYDTSAYPNDHFLYSSKNKKVIGKMKDEMADKAPIVEYVGLRAKMYSVLCDREIKKDKGVSNTVIRKDLTHESYLHVLRDKQDLYHSAYSIRIRKHLLSTEEQNKKSLSAFDGKRYMLNDIDTRAFAHWRTNDERILQWIYGD